jgi:cytochrome c5
MRHQLGSLATYVIAIMLMIGATVFAWTRSAQIAISTETAVVEQFRPASAHEFEWVELGRQSYVRNCQHCHLPGGEGWDQYPGVTHAARLFNAPGGREYLLDVHIYGLTSNRWRAPMPPMGHIPDVELAAVINHILTNFGNEQYLSPEAQLYLPRDVAARRGLALTPQQVNQRRPAIDQ